MKSFLHIGCGAKRKDRTTRGFKTVASMARGRAPYFDLFALASKSERPEIEMRELAGLHFPG
jgi:hypothetical protein